MQEHLRVQVVRVYPGVNEFMVVCRNDTDRKKLITTSKQSMILFQNAHVQIEELGDAEYSRRKNSVTEMKSPWSYSVVNYPLANSKKQNAETYSYSSSSSLPAAAAAAVVSPERNETGSQVRRGTPNA